MFKNPFSFEGRIRRTEYGLSYLLYVLGALAVSLISQAMRDYPASAFIVLLYIPMIWFLWAQGAKRCHDRDHSGWYQILPFYVFWMLFADSLPGENQYGPNPKGVGNFSEIDQLGNQLEP